jgi:hypothetical protein
VHEPRWDLDSERQEQRTALLLIVIAWLLISLAILVAVQHFA